MTTPTSLLDQEAQAELVALANLAPSAHNAQPTRWRFEKDETISLLVDPKRRLAASDPEDVDAGLSVGTALEGTVLALSQRGVGMTEIDDRWFKCETCPVSNHRLVARLALGGEVSADPLACWVERRYTFRGRFDPATDAEMADLQSWSREHSDITLATAKDDVAMIADLNDRASMVFLRSAPFRRELLSWMRLRRSHADWHLDGMNFEALAMTAFEARGASLFLSSPIFELADKIGLPERLASEKAKTLAASAVMLFHRPETETPLSSGRHLYRRWLEISELGFNAWPMSAVSDDLATAATIRERFELPPGRRFTKALRLGKAPPARTGLRARLRPDQLILPSK